MLVQYDRCFVYIFYLALVFWVLLLIIIRMKRQNFIQLVISLLEF